MPNQTSVSAAPNSAEEIPYHRIGRMELAVHWGKKTMKSSQMSMVRWFEADDYVGRFAILADVVRAEEDQGFAEWIASKGGKVPDVSMLHKVTLTSFSGWVN